MSGIHELEAREIAMIAGARDYDINIEFRFECNQNIQSVTKDELFELAKAIADLIGPARSNVTA